MALEMALAVSASRILARRILDNCGDGVLGESRTVPLRFVRRRGSLPVEAEGGTGMSDARIGLPQGTLDLLILKVLSLEPQHGWAISERLQQISTGVVHVQQGSLYPALHRLERRGWIKAEWAASDNNRQAKYYQLTRAGRRQLETETASWRTLSGAIGGILDLV